jgi:hypothetical protein
MYTRNSAPPGYLESARDINDEPDEDTIDGGAVQCFQPTKREVMSGRSSSFGPRYCERQDRVGHDVVVHCSVGSD